MIPDETPDLNPKTTEKLEVNNCGEFVGVAASPVSLIKDPINPDDIFPGTHETPLIKFFPYKNGVHNPATFLVSEFPQSILTDPLGCRLHTARGIRIR
jgi:hypothetical protein